MQRDGAFPKPPDDGDPTPTPSKPELVPTPSGSTDDVRPAGSPFAALRWFHSRSKEFITALQEAELLARDDKLPILITGETGTGKSYFARHIHNCSPRRDGSFVPVSLAAIHDGTAASDLRGHVKGSFTGADTIRKGYFVAADGGTLFLDELGKAPIGVQKLLLQACEERQIIPMGADRPVRINARLILAANEPLDELMQSGALLSDLFHRIGSAHIAIPPLRQRVQDIPALVEDMVERHAAELGFAHVPSIEPRLMRALKRAPWPGNVRQMDGALRVLMLLSRGASEITLGHRASAMQWLVNGLDNDDKRRSRINPVSREQAEAALHRCGGNRTEAARSIGVSRKTIHKALRRPWEDDSAGAAHG